MVVKNTNRVWFALYANLWFIAFIQVKIFRKKNEFLCLYDIIISRGEVNEKSKENDKSGSNYSAY